MSCHYIVSLHVIICNIYAYIILIHIYNRIYTIYIHQKCKCSVSMNKLSSTLYIEVLNQCTNVYIAMFSNYFWTREVLSSSPENDGCKKFMKVVWRPPTASKVAWNSTDHHTSTVHSDVTDAIAFALTAIWCSLRFR